MAGGAVRTAPGPLRAVARAYFRPKRFERGGRLYRRAGAHVFAKYWINGGSFWTRMKYWPLKLVRGTSSEALKDYVATAKVLEGLHVGLLAGLSAPSIASSLAERSYGALAYNVAAAVVTNVYPIMSLRMNRFRAERVLAIKARRAAKPAGTEDKGLPHSGPGHGGEYAWPGGDLGGA